MDILSDFRTAIQDDFSIGEESTLFPPSLLNRAINRAYTKAATLFRWPQLQDAKKTSTQAGVETYDYPQNFRPNSIYRLEVNSEQYGEEPDGSPLAFEDYLTWRADTANANSAEKKWANQQTRYFIFPVPTTTGSNNISVWGMKNHAALSEDSSITIFSYNMPECNEAILLEAEAILKSKGQDDKGGQFKSLEAKQILTVAYNKLKQEQNKYEKNQTMFSVQDMFSSTNTARTTIGNF